MMLKRLYGLLAAAVLLAAGAVPALAYRIQPGDQLQLEVLEDNSLNRSMLVLPDGTVTVPMVGAVHASGQTVDQLRATITKDLSPSFAAKPTVYLSIGALAPKDPNAQPAGTVTVYVMGEVAKAGAANVKAGTTLLQALATAGGFTNFAATRRIELLRQDRGGHQQAYHFDYDALMSGAASSAIVLRQGDVIVVPQRRLFE